MGCCHSTDRSVAPGAVDDGSRDNALARDQAARSIPPPGQSTRSHLPQSSFRPNQPIRAPSPLARSPKNVSNVLPPWTRSHLEQQRRFFFETRVTGHADIWATLQEVCTLLRQNDLAGAQVILDAANISCPNGRFAKGRGRNRDGRGKGGGVYDEQGVLYDIPEWVVVDPADIIEETHEKEIDAGSDGAEDDEIPYEGDDIGPASPGKEDKGKGRAEDVDMGEKVKLKCRLSTSQDMVVDYHSKQPAKAVVEGLKEQIGSKNVKLMFRGKVVDQSKPLSEIGWTVRDVLSAFVTN